MKLQRYIPLFVFSWLGFAALAQPDTQEEYLNRDIEVNRFDKENWQEATGVLDYQEAYFNEDIETNDFDEEEWQEAIEGLDYNEKEERPKQKNPWKFKTASGSFFGNMSWMKIFWYMFGLIALGVLLYFVIRYAANLQAGQKKKKKAYTIEEAEENLLETDLQRFLKDALARGDYRMAVRVYYLEILKQLSLNNRIKWQRDKTNSEYLREMRKNNHFKDFRHITRIFERVWYGDTTIGKDIYQQISPEFENYLKLMVND